MRKKSGWRYIARRSGFRRKKKKHFNKNKFSAKKHATSAEVIVALAFSELVSESFFSAFVRAKHNDSLDASHIDIVAINFDEQKLFILQVKTKVKKKICKHDIQYCEQCETPTERHKRKYASIPVIEVKLGQEKRLAIRKAKIKIKKLYKESPSAEEILDKRTLNIITERFNAFGYEVFFKK